MVLWGVVVMLFVSLLSFVVYSPFSSNALMLKSLTFSIPAWLAFAWVSAMLLKGNSRSHYRWAYLTGFSAFAFLFGGAGTTNLINGAFDHSPRVTRVETVTKKSSSRSKNSTTYRVHFNSLSHPGSTDSVTVGSSEWNRVVEHRTRIELTTSSGALGVELLRGKRLLFE